MQKIIKENSPNSVWTGSPLESFRGVANTNRGDIGEEFVVRYLDAHDVSAVRSPSRNLEWDIEYCGKQIEVKTASQDRSGTFQFNHIRLDRRYNFLLCLAVRPSAIRFGLWSKGEVAEGGAGTLVRMAEGQSITFKLTKRTEHLSPIEDLAKDFVEKASP